MSQLLRYMTHEQVLKIEAFPQGTDTEVDEFMVRSIRELQDVPASRV